MSEDTRDILDLESEFDRLLASHRVKTQDEIEVERAFPSLPPHVLKSRTAKEFLWLSSSEKNRLIQTGDERGGCLDPWTQVGG